MSEQNILDGIKFRIRHTMLPVSDIRRTVDFYTRFLGMDVMRLRKAPERNLTTVYLGYGCEDDQPALELVQTGNPGEIADVPKWAGHTAVFVSDLQSLCQRLKTEGISMVSDPTPVQPGGRDLVAWIRDPDGYSIELTERHSVTGAPMKPGTIDL